MILAGLDHDLIPRPEPYIHPSKTALSDWEGEVGA